MDIPADAVFLSSDHKRDLTVSLQTDQPVNDMAACLLQLFRPLDIVFLVEAGLQLDKRGYLLPVLRCLRQSRNDRGILIARTEGSADALRIRFTTGSKV